MNHKNKHLIQLQKDFGPIVLKFGLSEKIAKCAQSQSSSCFVHLFSKRPNHEEDFFKFCVLLRKSKLYINHIPISGAEYA